ncbi:MAG: GspH/FimT family pseudopilin [Gemmatimonadaceae bacterium]
MLSPLSRRSRRAWRRGFSIIELMIVFVIFGLVLAIGVPRFNYMRETSQMRSAKSQITSLLATARATAIRRAKATEVRRDANMLVVISGTDTVVRPVRLDTLYRVTLATAAPTTVRYDARGVASSMASGATALTYGTFKFQRESFADSVCVTRLGQVQKDGCFQ